jgi:hypothetical protein
VSLLSSSARQKAFSDVCASAEPMKQVFNSARHCCIKQTYGIKTVSFSDKSLTLCVVNTFSHIRRFGFLIQEVSNTITFPQRKESIVGLFSEDSLL